jgi:Spy/CpxP family protein refolding chaperone
MNPERLKDLGATDDQIQKVQDIQFASREQAIELRAKEETAQLALDKLLKSDAPDQAAVMQAVDQLTAARGAMFKQHITTQLKVREVLGPELSQKLREQPRPPRMGRDQGPGRPPFDRPQGDRPPREGRPD